MDRKASPPSIAVTPGLPRASTLHKSSASLVAAAVSLGLLHAAAQGQCFRPAVHYGAGSNPCSVAVGDYNSDGRPDLAVANFGGNSISILLGDPSVPGTFQAKVDHGVGAGPFFVATADFNWDGAQDLAVGNLNDNNISILLGNGDGTFQPRVNYATGTWPNGVTIADLNWDGQLDLAIPNYGGTTVSVLVGNGDGTFQAAADYPAGTSPTCIAAADFNWDGLTDLAVSNEGSNDVSILLGDPSLPGTFLAPASCAVGGAPQSIAAGDFNGDPIPDLAVANSSSNNASILIGNGDGTFQPAANYATGSGPWSVALGDLDGDTRLDLAVANSGGNISVLLGNPGGTFQAKTDFAVGSNPLFVGASDLNGDGFLDLVSANVGSNDISVLLGLDSVWYPDADGDTYGDAGGKLTTCTPPNGYVTRGGDCDDANPAVNAGAAEVCGNGIDDDCDGKIDEGVGSAILGGWQATSAVTYNEPFGSDSHDQDGTGGNGGQPLLVDLRAATGGSLSETHILMNTGGVASSWSHSVAPDHGYSEQHTGYIFEFTVPSDSAYAFDGFYQAIGQSRMSVIVDLWDRQTGLRLFRQQIDGTTTDPSMVVGQDPTWPWYHSMAGSPSGMLPAGYYRLDVNVFLSQGQTAPGVQGQGALNLVISSVSFADADSDGYGDPGTSSMACPPPPGYVAIGGDCNDADPAIYPGAAELCDAKDNDCDGQIDEGLTPSTWYADADGDAYGDPASTVNACTQPNGYVAQTGDCDDTNAAVNPGATEVCDGLDNDCDAQTDEGLGTTWYADGDSDGYGDGLSPLVACSQPGGYVAIAGDCDDANAAVHPGATEVCNGIDDNCDGQTDEGVGTTWYADADGDMYGDPAVQTVACAQPGGYVAIAGDCDDANAAVNPGATEVCYNNIDDDCDGLFDEGCCPVSFDTSANYPAGANPTGIASGDFDGDGVPDLAVSNGNGNDISILMGNPNGTFSAPNNFGVGAAPRHPAVADFDHDGALDLAVPNSYSGNVSILMGNGDGTFDTADHYGSYTLNYTVAVGDFNADGDPDIVVPSYWTGNVHLMLGNGDGTFQGAVPIAVGLNPVGVVAADFDGDAYPDLAVANGGGYTVSILHGTANGTFQAAVNYPAGTGPGWITVGYFNGDARADLAVVDATSQVLVLLADPAVNGAFLAPVSYYAGANPSGLTVGDFNGDGITDVAAANWSAYVAVLLGNPDGTLRAAVTKAVGGNPTGIAAADFDGDGRTDVATCNFYGNNASVLLNSSPGLAWYPDLDGDGYGDPSGIRVTCYQLNGYIAMGGDCDDADAAIHPGATEICDGKDNDCDGTPDDGLTLSTWYADADGDAYGDPASTLLACSQPNGYVAIAGDCDDTNAAVNPGATETCNNLDDDCDGQTDEGLGTTWYADSDGDTWGDGGNALVACSQPNGYVAQAGDCDDTDATVYPGAPELCDGLDNDCDAQTDEGLGPTWYADADSDTWGDAAVQVVACAQPGGYVAIAGDCDDSAAAVNPGAAEVCANNIDDDCDGLFDEGCCPVTFQAAVNYSAGNHPNSVAVGDFNGDGKPDLATANWMSGNVSILLGNTNGTFQAAVNYTAGAAPWSIAVGDFNGDGKLDLAVVNQAVNVSILRGNGDGTFQGAVYYAAGTGAYSVAVGDVSGDGRPDLAVANFHSNDVSILLCNADGTFQPAVAYAAGINPFFVALGDFNGDGRTDVATANLSGNDVSILLGNPNGTFQAAANYAVGVYPTSVAAGDFNGDGRSDLAASSIGTSDVSILLSNPNGTLQAAVSYGAGATPYSVAVGDFNGDGRADVATADSIVNVLLGNPDGTFQPAVGIQIGWSARSVAVGDFDRDGRPDLAFAAFPEGEVVVLLNSSPGSTWYADLDHDTYGDPSNIKIACVQPIGYLATGGDCDDTDAAIHPGATELCNGLDDDCNGTLDDGLPTSTWYADSDGDAFGDAADSVLACAAPSGYVAIGGDCDDADPAVNPGATETCNGTDDNCDGQADEGLGQTWYADADGDGYGNPSHTLFDCNQPNGYVAIGGDCDDNDASINPGATEVCNGADDDCDGTPDDGLGFNTWYPDLDSDGYGDAAGAYTDCFQPNGYVGQAGDCDDGDANVNPGVFEVCGNGIDDDCNGQVDEDCCPISFLPKSDTSAGGTAASPAVADFNGDGRLDIAVANQLSHTITILLQAPNGGFTNFATLPVGSGPHKITSADFNSDGIPDLAAACSNTSKVSVLLGRGDGAFHPYVEYGVGTRPAGVATADFDGDGALDLAVANSQNGRISILPGNGDGTFKTHDPYIVGSTPLHLAAADFDGDGHPDLAVANQASNTISVFRGKGDGTLELPRLDVPTGASPGFIAIADYNADGDLDLAVVSNTTKQVFVHRGNGDGTFNQGAPYATGTLPYAVIAADLDGDPYLDLAVTNGQSNTVSILAGKPDGTFKPQVTFAVSASPAGLVPADFNRDGRADLVVANFGSGSISILLNDGGTWLWSPDSDADGFGDPGANPIRDCVWPNGYAANASDCDDSDPATYPGARDICDGDDNDCDGITDEHGDPIITQDPAALVANLGDTIQFGVTSIGGTAWQWRKNGTPIFGAIGPFHSIIGVQESDAALYSVIVFNNCGQTTSADAALTVQPAAPSNLNGLEVSKGNVTLSWTDNSSLETAFQVWRAAYAGGVWGTPTLVATLAPNTTSYSQSPGIGVWRYRIRAVNGNINSAWTSFEAIKPAAPSGLTLQKIQPGKAKLTWTDNSNFEASFTIERQKFNGFAWGSTTTLPTQGANTTTYTDTPGTGKYRYRIRASNVAGNSVWVGWVSVNL